MSASPAGQPLHVLLVEDNAADADLVREELRGRPVDIDHVARLSDALERLRHGRADAVLLDLSLPDAQDVEGLLRLTEAAPGTPVVVVTGSDDEEVGARLVHAGAQDYLVKGRADGALLMRSLRYAIERHGHQQRQRELAGAQAAREAAETALKRLRALQRVADAALSSLSVEELLVELLGRVRGALDSDTATVALLDAQRRVLRVRASAGLEEEVVAGVEVPVGEGFIGRIAARREPLFVQDLAHFPTFSATLRQHLRSVAGVPLESGGRLLGVLHVGSRQARHFGENDLALLRLAAERVVAALERARRFEQEREARADAEQRRDFVETLLQTVGALVVVIDADGRMVRFNRECEQVTGFKAEEVLGRPVLDLVPADQRPSVAATWELLVREGAASARENDWLCKDGSRRRIAWNNSVLRDAQGRVAYVMGTGIDVTEARRATEALRTANLRLRSFVEANIVGVVVADARGGIVESNDYYLEVLGVTRADLEAGRVDWRRHTPREWLAADEHALGQLRARGICDPYEKQYVRPDGARRWVLLRHALLPGPERHIVAFVVDITERKRAEQELRASEERLREQDRRKDEFLAVLSHELRNPLAPVRNSLHVLERAQPLNERGRRAADIIGRQVQHLSRLIDDLLDATRIARGKVRLQRERLELGALVRRTVDDHAHAFADSGVTLRAELPEAPVWVEADGTRLAQVVGNLLGNAAKFTPRGGAVCVRLEAAGEALLEIEDTGIGIEPELLERVFEPFTQADRTLDRSRGGLGLGLALVKGLVELHDGSVSARSDGAGTSIRVALPLHAPPAADAAAPAADAAAAAGPRRVLVIEDNADAAESLRDLLMLGGHEVRVASNGVEGLRMALSDPPDVVLCDLGLPELDGFEVARALRSEPALRCTRLVALSGYARPEDRRRSSDAGFDLHLAKPPDVGALERVLALTPDPSPQRAVERGEDHRRSFQ